MSQWRVAIGQKQYGPYSLEKLREIHQEGRIPADAQIWHPDRQAWLGVEHIGELYGESSPLLIVEEAAPASGVTSRSASQSFAGSAGSADTLGDYLAFRRMITPIIIQIIFWLGAVLSSMGGIFMMIASIRMNDMGGVFVGFFTMLLGPVAVRVYCELLIVFFRMNETLTEIHNEIKRSS